MPGGQGSGANIYEQLGADGAGLLLARPFLQYLSQDRCKLGKRTIELNAAFNAKIYWGG